MTRLVRAAALVLALGLALPTADARAIEQSTPARAAIVTDLTSGAVLFEKNADRPLPPASMSKLMTLYMVFEAIDAGRLALEDEFRTSKKASDMGGSKMFIREGEVVSVEDLIRGVVVQSGNDAAVALAEALAGTEAALATVMNRRAAELGLENSHFTNATGWPAPEHRMSVRDLARLSERIIRDFPDLYTYFAETEFTWDDITQKNRNPLLGIGLGVDGLKTGHTEEAGYGLAASAKRGERRVIVVVAGLDSPAQRLQESERLINWAFRAFDIRRLFQAGETLAEAEVWIGAEGAVALTPAEDVVAAVPFGRESETRARAEFRAPVEAPIEAGETLGRVIVATPGVPEFSVPLVAAHPVARGGLLARIEAAAVLVLDRLGPAEAGAPAPDG